MKNMKRIRSITVRWIPDNDDDSPGYRIGIRAEAEVYLTRSDLLQTVASGGLWRLEMPTCDCASRSWSGDHHDTACPVTTDSYLADVETDELRILSRELYAIGLSKRAISAAMKNVERKDF